MFIDINELGSHSTIDADVCIIGAGAAGISIARRLSRSGLRICMLEGGGENATLADQDLYRGEVTGLPYLPLEASRLRFLGGSTNHWGGACLPLDPDDFEQRDWVPNSGWPIDFNTLLPFYEDAQQVCQLGPFIYNAQELKHEKQPLTLPLDNRAVRSRLRQQSPPTRFGFAYRDDLAKAKAVSVYLNANVTELELAPGGEQVTRAIVQTLKERNFFVKARNFVLATGGIENARLLLQSNSQQSAGIGNQHDLVGRYFSDHYYFSRLANFVIADNETAMDFYTGRVTGLEGITATAGLSLPPEVRRQQRLLNVCFHLSQTNWNTFAGYHHAFPGLTTKEVEGTEIAKRLARRTYGVLLDVAGLAKGLYGTLAGTRVFNVGAWIEHIPNPESRILLTKERDALGQRRVEMKWQLDSREKQSVLRSLELLGAELARSNVGRLFMRLDENTEWPRENFKSVLGGTPGYHHMGTTRMSSDPKRGVVDADCRVHGTRNLFIAGSSVFPTFGQANPTLTIVALALRLAEHIEENLR